MVIEVYVLLIQSLIAIITLISVILIYKTIKSNERLNQMILFDRITKEERELRIRFQEYRERAENKKLTQSERERIIFNYETLLFNYYEYVAISLFKSLIKEEEANLYFRDLLISVKELFETSLLFEKKVANKEEYPGMQWLFRKWSV